MVATLAAKNTNEAAVAPMVGFGGSLESGGRFCVGAFGGNLALVAVKVFSCLVQLKKNLCKFCTFQCDL
jgi:hypothetical protein